MHDENGDLAAISKIRDYYTGATVMHLDNWHCYFHFLIALA